MLAPATSDAVLDPARAGRDHLRAGRVTAALRVLEQVAEPSVDVLALLLECRLARGELGPAGVVGERVAAHVGAPGAEGAVAAHALAELATALGDHERAAAGYADAGALLPDDPELVPWRVGAALALTRLARHREARPLAVEHVAAVRPGGSPYTVALALRTMAATSTDGGRHGLLREARAALAGSTAERLAAQIDTDLAVLLVLEGRPGEAVALLRSAEEYAGREDLFPLQTRVRELLQRLGEQPARIRRETLAQLTPTEHKAARLAASGLTNREIAGQLNVTVKAVEWHLSHVYRKLGIKSRVLLADSLGQTA